jgi:membrane-bound lytic murein transglycosylase B
MPTTSALRHRRGVVFVALALVLMVAAPSSPARAASEPFDAWLEAFRAEARADGISEATLDRALDGLAPIPRVVELDRQQIEGRIDFVTYKTRVLSEDRIRRGRELYREHADLLRRVAADYGVQPRFIVALWGIESTYGTYKGSYPVIASLATLAWDGRRAEFFRGELLNALRIVDSGDIDAEAMSGSWAGAMGQSQFMPSSFLGYAVDYDGDGRRDIWNSTPDVFASIANYLARAGWNDAFTWGRQVEVPPAIDPALLGLETELPLESWQDAGVRALNGHALPQVNIDASLLWMDDRTGPAYLVYDNFRVIMRWNRSTYFAVSVGELAELVRTG